MSAQPGTQTTIYANYVQLTGHSLSLSSFYDRFTEPYAELMEQLAHRALQAVRAVAPLDPETEALGRLSALFGDVRVADSTSQLLCKLAAAWAPSTSPKRPAAFKIHAVLSLKDNLPVEYHLSSQRAHDNPQLEESAIVAGTLFLADLGYVDQARMIRQVEAGSHVLMRLKKSQNPVIKRVHVGKGRKRECRGKGLDEAFEEGLLDFEKGEVDLDVVIEAQEGKETLRRSFRVVGLCQDEGEGEDSWFYLTSVPREALTPQEVSLCYTLRWDIELFWKHLKGGVGLSAIQASREEAVKSVVHAKILAVALARLLELSTKEATREHATAQLAIVLCLTRMIPLLMAMRLQERQVSLQEMERRLLLLATVLGKSRRQRRERAKKAKREKIGQHT
jgi:hypothetical protein